MLSGGTGDLDWVVRVGFRGKAHRVLEDFCFPCMFNDLLQMISWDGSQHVLWHLLLKGSKQINRNWPT